VLQAPGTIHAASIVPGVHCPTFHSPLFILLYALRDGAQIMRRTLTAWLLVGGASLTAIALVAATAALSAPQFAPELAHEGGAAPVSLNAAASPA
jgi:hypothetical protein